MADIIITPGSSIMSFTSSLNYTQTLTQQASGSLTLQGSGSTGRTDLFTVNGNNGTLFSVSDDLSNSLFSVNTIAGLPVIEAFADNTVVMGQYGQNVLVVTGSSVSIGSADNAGAKLRVNGTSLFDGEQSIYYTNATQTMVGQTGYSLFRMYGNSNGVEVQLDAHAFNSTAGTVGTFSNSDFFIKSNNTNRIAVKAGGNVGIGTTSPAYLLSINGTTSIVNNSSLLLLDTAGNPGFQITNTNSNVALLHQNNSGAIRYRAGFTSNSNNAHIFAVGNDTEIVRFTNDGNVGIGTTSPSEKLEVNGSIRLNDGNADGSQLKLASSGYSDWNLDNYLGNFRAYYGSTEYFRITSGGALKLASYGSGTNTGTAAYTLAVDTSGNVIETAAAGGGGGGVHILLKPQSNKKYGLGVTGEYSFTSGNTTANQIILAPFIPANSITIRSLEVNVTAVNAGGLCRILVYRDLDGKPYNKIIESSDLSSASTGTKTYLVNYTFNAGTTYWIGIHANDSINLNIHNASQVMQIDYFISVWPYISKTSTSYTFGSAPSTLDIQESSITNPFVVLLTSN